MEFFRRTKCIALTDALRSWIFSIGGHVVIWARMQRRCLYKQAANGLLLFSQNGFHSGKISSHEGISPHKSSLGRVGLNDPQSDLRQIL